MTWQDELRQLDEELAAGRLSAEDYRRRRDELLSQGAAGRPSAQAQQPQQPSGGQPSGPDQAQPQGAPAQQGPGQQGAGQPGQQGQGANPFPPPFRWDQTPAAESTQVMRPISGDAPPGGAQRPAGDGDRTQVVPGAASAGSGAAADGGQSGNGSGAGNAGNGDAERTQVVPGGAPGMTGGQPTFPPRPPQGPGGPGGPGQGGPGRPGQGFGQGQTVAPWQQQGQNTSPPWANSDLPPQTDMPPVWLRQGPESFEKTEESSKTKTIVLAVVAVVVLAALGVGAFLIFRPDGESPVADPTTTQQAPTTTSAAPTTPPGPPVAELPGTAQDTSQVEAFADVEALQYLTPEEVALYEAGGAGESKLAVSNDDDGVQALVLIVQATDEAAAGTARDALATLQDSYQLTRAADSPTGVISAGTDGNPTGPLRRAHYASDDLIVRIEVQGTASADAIDRIFEEVLGAQLDVMPASTT